MKKKYTITIYFKCWDSEPLVVQADGYTTSYENVRREPIFQGKGYPSSFEVACADVRLITCEENSIT